MSLTCAYTYPERPAGEQLFSRRLRPQSRFRIYGSQCHVSEKLAPAASRQPRPLSLRPSCRSGPLVGRALTCRSSTMHVDRKQRLLPQSARTWTSSGLCRRCRRREVAGTLPCLLPPPGGGPPLHPLAFPCASCSCMPSRPILQHGSDRITTFARRKLGCHRA